MITRPTTVTDLQDVVKTHHHLLLRGGGSKPALSTPLPATAVVEMGGLSGLLEYDPGEYTFTAYAGTAVADIEAELAQHGQYLPFDPLWTAEGATLGGTVAANSAGSGRFRYGGVRDFILGVRFVDGHGRLVRSGGKVVKNAAGFDLPKFMVGSLGRYGALVAISFKVFPRPPATQTLAATYAGNEAALAAIFALATRPFELAALDVQPGEPATLVLRLGGLAAALPDRIARLQRFLGAETAVLNQETVADEAAFWQEANRLAWAAGTKTWVKVPIWPRLMPDLDAAVRPFTPRRRYTAGANVAWLATDDVAALEAALQARGLAGLCLHGRPGQVYLGQRQGVALAQRVKQALDPDGRFLPDDTILLQEST